MATYKKEVNINGNEILIEEIPTMPVTRNYTLKSLNAEKARIEKLIAQCEELGINE